MYIFGGLADCNFFPSQAAAGVVGECQGSKGALLAVSPHVPCCLQRAVAARELRKPCNQGAG